MSLKDWAEENDSSLGAIRTILPYWRWIFFSTNGQFPPDQVLAYHNCQTIRFSYIYIYMCVCVCVCVCVVSVTCWQVQHLLERQPPALALGISQVGENRDCIHTTQPSLLMAINNQYYFLRTLGVESWKHRCQRHVDTQTDIIRGVCSVRHFQILGLNR
jgi:hypothetical protein